MRHLTSRDLYVRYLNGETTIEEIERAVRETVARYRQLEAATTDQVRETETLTEVS